MKTISDKTTNHILIAAVAVLALLCFFSIATPLKFDSERTERETAVKQRLLLIRSAEERFMRRHGYYTSSLDSLVQGRYLADSLRFIPFSGGKTFEIETSAHVSTSGKAQPLMECSARYADYLTGLDANSIAEITDEANSEGRFPGLKIGDITTPNGNAANW